MTALVELDRVSKTFEKDGRRVEALSDVSFEVCRGELLALIGASGCGKSTLLNLAGGLMAPTRGEIRYDGEAVRDVNTRMGYITQHDTLLPWRTVEGNVKIALELKGLGAAEQAERAGAMIRRVGLAEFERHYPHELSGGMRKRVGLARALVYDPEALLMDEPFGALDAQLRVVMQGELLRIWEETRKTIVFVTHDLDEALALSDRVVVLSRRPGRLKAVVDVALPRPRDINRVRYLPEYRDLHARLWDLLKDDVLAAAGPDR
jgi:NitT/TauT family transport system ATP-binding protein